MKYTKKCMILLFLPLLSFASEKGHNVRLTKQDFMKSLKEFRDDWNAWKRRPWNAWVLSTFKSGNVIDSECPLHIYQLRHTASKTTFPQDEVSGVYRVSIVCTNGEEKDFYPEPDLSFLAFDPKSNKNAYKIPTLTAALQKRILKQFSSYGGESYIEERLAVLNIRFRVIRHDDCSKGACKYNPGWQNCGPKVENDYLCFQGKLNTHQVFIELLE